MMKLFLLLLLTELVVSTEATTSRTSNYLRGNYDRVLKKNKLDNIDWEQFTADLAAMTDVPTTKPSLHPTTATPSTAEPTVSPTTATPSSVPSKELTLTPTKHPSNQPTTAPTIQEWLEFTGKPTEQPSSISTNTPAPTKEVSDILDTIPPTTAIAVGATPTAQPTQFNFLFTLGDSVITEVPLPPFRLDFVATANNVNRKLREDDLLVGEAETAFIGIISNQILFYLQSILPVEVKSVELEVGEKMVKYFPQDEGNTVLVLFSYIFSGSIAFNTSYDEVPTLPTSQELQTKVVECLKTGTLVEALKSFDNTALLSVDDTVVSIPSGTASQIQKADDSSGVISNSIDGGTAALITTPILVAFVTVFAIIGFINMRSYRKHHQTENDTSIDVFRVSTPQNMKAKISKLSPMPKSRHYNQFESPQGSEDSLFGDMEENGDVEYLVTSDAVDMEQLSFPNQSKYDSEMGSKDGESDTTSERDIPNRTLDLLYSDSDSYFESNHSQLIGRDAASAAFSDYSSIHGDIDIRPRVMSKETNNLMYSDTDSSIHDSEHRLNSSLEMMKINHQNIVEINQLLLDGETSASDLDSSDVAGHAEDELGSQLSHKDVATTYESLGSDGVLTDEVLGMIQRDRLRGTPPPSEGDFDRDAVDAKDHNLLGNMSDESDADDDELLFNE